MLVSAQPRYVCAIKIYKALGFSSAAWASEIYGHLQIDRIDTFLEDLDLKLSVINLGNCIKKQHLCRGGRLRLRGLKTG